MGGWMCEGEEAAGQECEAREKDVSQQLGTED